MSTRGRLRRVRRGLPLVAGALALSAVAACASDTSPAAGGSTPTGTDPPSASSGLTATSSPTQPEPLPWGPTADEYAEAESIVADMSAEQQAGQVIVARYDGPEPPVELIAELGLGGVIVMGDNIESTEQLRTATAAVQDADARPYPMVVGVDQEGGTVARVREPATEFPAYMTLGAARDPELATDVARASGEELRSLGFTMVFAPDADVTTGPDDPTIGSRSASSNPRLVAELVAGSLAGYAEAGIVAVAKHFPGHGSVPADSHDELPVQTAPLERLEERDLVPFQAAVDAGAPAVMVAHIDVEAVDPGVPSSLSGEVIDLLRSRLEFDGLVVTDAQDMAAISASYRAGEAAVRSLRAGADVVLMPADVRAAHAGIVTAVKKGRLPRERLEEAAVRVVATMLHQQSAGEQPSSDVLGSHGDVSYRASLAGVTIAAGECEGSHVGDSVRVSGGTEHDRERFIAAAKDAGLSVGSGDTVRLLGGDARAGSADVVVSLDTPYALGRSEAGTAKIALYGRTPAAFRALVDVLRGEETGHGRLPVDVEGAEQLGCPSAQ